MQQRIATVEALPMTDVIRRASREACDGCGESTAVTEDTLKVAGLLCLRCQVDGRLALGKELRLRARAAALESELRGLRQQIRSAGAAPTP